MSPGRVAAAPTSPEEPLRPACRSDPGSYQVTAPARGLSVCEILCAPSKSESLFLQSPGAPEVKPQGPTEPSPLGLLLPSAEPPGLRAWDGTQNSRSCGEPLLVLTQSCPTLCGPKDRSLQGSSAHGILQGRILEKVAISNSRGSSQPRYGICVSCISWIGRRILYH